MKLVTAALGGVEGVKEKFGFVRTEKYKVKYWSAYTECFSSENLCVLSPLN